MLDEEVGRITMTVEPATRVRDIAVQEAAASAPAQPKLGRCGVIGYGYWGPQLVRNLDRLVIGHVDIIADFSADRRQVAHFEHPTATIADNGDAVLESDVDAVVVATPIRTHYRLAKAALERGKHVFVEKPLTANSREAEELI